MECNKLGLGKRFLKVRAKVTGFLVAKIEKHNIPEQVIIAKKKNIISTTGLQYLLNAFQTYMSDVNYLGENAPSPGIVINTSSGQQVTLPFISTPAVYATSNFAIISFTVRDDTTNSYTAVSEELVTTSAGYNIPIATTSLPVTKNSDEILTMTWTIQISISTPNNITYIPTLTPQSAGVVNCAGGSGCSYCTESSANSEYSFYCTGESPIGLSSQYPQTNFVTTQLFTDMFYNTYSKGLTNSFTQVSGTTLIIYTIYCMVYFVAGVNSGQGRFVTFNPSGSACFIASSSSEIDTAYLQVYMPSETASYMGVQIEFTT